MRKNTKGSEGPSRKVMNILLTLSFLAIGTALSGCVTVSEYSSNPRDHDFGPDCRGLGSSVDNFGNVHAVWMEEVKEYGTNYTKVYYTKASMEGNILIQPILLLVGDPIGKNFDIPQCSVAADSKGGAHVVFGLNGDLHYTKIDKEGKSVRPRQITAGYDRSLDPDMTLDSQDRAHMVWTDWRYDSSRILYLRMDRFGGSDSEVKVVGPEGSYNPSIIVDQHDSLYIAFYNEYGIYISQWWLFFWVTYSAVEVSHIVLIKSDLELENPMLLETGVTDFDWDDLETMGLGEGPEGGVYLYWTSYDAMRYRCITPEVALEKDLFKKNETFQLDENGAMSLEYSNFSYILDHHIDIEIQKDEILPKEGEILLSFNNGPFISLGDYSLPVQVRGNVSKRYSFDVSEMITSDGKISIKLRDIGKTGSADIINAEIIREVRLRKGDWQETNPIHGTMVLRPSVATDRFGNLIVAWFQREGEDKVVFSTVDRNGEIKQSEVTVFSSDEEIKDISVKTNNWGEVNILWTSRSDEDNYLRHAVYDQRGNVVVDPYLVSKNHREWERLDDLGGPWGLFFMIATPIVVTISTITFGLIMWRKRVRRKAAFNMVLDFCPQPPTEEVVFEVLRRG